MQFAWCAKQQNYSPFAHSIIWLLLMYVENFDEQKNEVEKM